MGSGIYFPICALSFSILTLVNFFVKKTIRTTETKIYKYLLVTNFVGLLIELLCTFAAFISNDFPIMSDIILKSYLVYNLMWTLELTIYVLHISINNDNFIKYKKKIKTISIFLFTICSLIIYKLDCYLIVKDNFRTRYTEGPSVEFTYIASGALIFLIGLLIIKNIKEFKSKKYIPIYIFIIMLVVAIIIQKNIPGLLIMTYVETLTVAIMYHTIENPDMKLLDELHKAKEISDNANEEKTLFLYNMTEEIRNTTNEIDNEANYILNSDSIEEDKNCARNIKGITSKFNTMTNDIMDVSKIDEANLKVYNDKYNIKIIIKELVTIYDKMCGSKELAFRTNIDHDIPDILYGDSIRLKEVLNTIINNSVKYTNKGFVELSINTIIKNNICRLIITIEDSGIGFKSDEINKIKLDNKSLSVANKLITLMNGTMIISSNYGMGTKIKIILDQKIGEKEVEGISKYDEIYNDLKILMVDDSLSGIKIIEKLLRDSNIKLDTSNNGKDCISKIKMNKYDLILLDEDLSQIKGFELLKKIKSIRNFNTKVILLTKDNSYEYNDKYIEYGFTDYLLKPVKKEELLNIISKYTKN